ncbi:MAG: hypothetical protein HKN37_15765, partial [Rhodothermales bacterium]|nr:hypothetical protein [Rhodothermales bacterium]
MNLTLAFQFEVDPDSEQSGRVLLWDGEVQIQDDELSEIRHDGPRLAFRIPAKGTTFTGELVADGERIAGRFGFPDGSQHEVDVARVAGLRYARTMPSSVEDGQSLVLEISRAEAKEDVQFLMSVIAREHPAPYRFVAADSLKAAADRIAKSLPATVSTELFLQALRPLMASVRCVHTSIRAPESLEAKTSAESGHLPFGIRIFGGRTLVTETRGHDKVDLASRVVSINGTAIDEVVRIMIASISADGYSDAFPMHVINRGFARAYAAAFGRTDSFTLELVRTDGTIYVANVDGTPLSSDSETEPLRLSLSFRQGTRIAYLRVPTFGPPDLAGAMSALDGFFGDIVERGSAALIVDLRGNTGGHPRLASQLLSHLVAEPFRYFVGDSTGSGDLAILYREQTPASNTFTRQVVVLMDGAGVSTTGHFLALARVLRVATLIGESGSSFWSNDNSHRAVLPASNLEVNVPTHIFSTVS